MKMQFSSLQTNGSYRQLRFQLIWVAVSLLLLAGGITLFQVVSALPGQIPIVSAELTSIP